MFTEKIMLLGNEQYIEALKSGDRAVLRRIYIDFSPDIMRMIAGSGGTREDAREVFQSALVALFERARLDALPTETRFEDLLRQVCRQIWRSRKTAAAQQALEDVPLDAALEEEISREERNRLFREHLKRLGAACQMLLAFFFEGRPMDDICEQMGHQRVDDTLQQKDRCKNQLMEHIRKDPRFAELAA